MKNKINIAELLIDCPKGTKLYSPIFGEVCLDKIRPHLAIIVTTDKYKEEFLYDGRYGMNGECMLFPSKDQRDWSKFQRPFEDGDILVHTQNQRLVTSIYRNRVAELIIGTHCILWDKNDGLTVNAQMCCYPEDTRFATEEEKAKLFQAIKANGYYWDPDNKTLKPLLITNFKVGDKIKYKYGKNKDGVEYGKILSITDNTYDVAVTDNMGIFIPVEQQNDWELLSDKVEPLFKVGDEIVKKNGITNSYIVQSVNDEYYGLQLPDKSGVGVLPTKDQDDWMVISSKPKFKVGDEVYNKKTDVVGTISKIYDDEKEYMVNLKKGGITYICFEHENCWDLVSNKVEPKFKIGDKIKKKDDIDYRLRTIESINNNHYIIKTPDWFDNCYITDKLPFDCQNEYELIHSNKFDINNLKPFESRVLVRDTDHYEWEGAVFGRYDVILSLPLVALIGNIVFLTRVMNTF